MKQMVGSISEVDLDSQGRRRIFFLFCIVPILAISIFSMTALRYGTPGFRVDKTQQGLLVSKVFNGLNPVQVGDLIVGMNGLSYPEILGRLVLSPLSQGSEPVVVVLRGQQTFSFQPVLKPLRWRLFFSIAWPHLVLVGLFLTLGLIALLRAPPGQPALLFFFMLCSFSNTIAMTLPSQFGLLQPKIISLSFLGIALSNWLSFGAFAHFNCCFPKERDLFARRPYSALLLYLIPMIIGIGGALVTAGFTEEFFTALQHFRNMCVPLLLVGSFVKHAFDLRVLVSPSAKNQVKLILFAYWPTYAPYLLLYLIPNLLIDRPLISFRIVLLAATILPTAHLIALIRYNLMGVDRLISRVLAYFAVILFLTLLYVSMLALLKRWVFGREIFSEEIFLLFLLIIVLGITPFINWFQRGIDRYFFRYRPDDHSVLSDFSQEFASVLQFSDFTTLLNDKLSQKLQVTQSALLLIEEKRSRLFPEDLRIGTTPWPQSRLIEQFHLGKQAFLCLEKQNDPQLDLELFQLGQAGFHLVLPLRRGSDISGFLLFGQRKDGRLFRDHDIQMLSILANQAAVALDNSLHYTSLVKSKEQIESLFGKVVQAKKMASLGEMTATLAHEIKTPLGIIRSSAQYLAKEDRAKAINQEILGFIISEVDGLNSVVSNILGLAKFKKPVLRAIDLQQEIPYLWKQWQHSGDHNPAVQIHCSVAPRLPLLYGDFQQLRSVLLNLAKNSEEALDGEGNIRFSIEQQEDIAVLRLEDDGPGIAEEYVEELFSNFFTTKEDGLGMGLSVSKQIIAAHHGTLTIRNGAEKGVEVLIHLPFRPLVTEGLDDNERGEIDECKDTDT
jgi:signal transduction histidine kinase